jgi:hypothetical protein
LQIGDEITHLGQGALGEISDARPIFLKDQLQLPAGLVEVLGQPVGVRESLRQLIL